jgi:hypothetical protein
MLLMIFYSSQLYINVRKTTGALLVVGKQVAIVVSTERTKCKFTSVEQNAG